MNVEEFVTKWNSANISERAGYQAHFNDLCELFEVQKPTELGVNDEQFCFEKRAARAGKKAKGWADVWKKDCFAWEYKGTHNDLDEAYAQLLRYHDDLGNVPVLVVCDLKTIIVHVKRTNRATVVRPILLESLAEFPSPSFEFLKQAFRDPQNLETGEEIEFITQNVASRLGKVADSLKERYLGEDERIARFLDRIVFGFFAEDAGLLPKGVLQRILEKGQTDAARVSRQFSQLFKAMKDGGDFGDDEIRHFNGSLFNALDAPLAVTEEECKILLEVSRKNWAEIDPSIFGTLFERSLDDEKRAQLGAHYTSRADIETLIEPVILQPLRREWEKLLLQMNSLVLVEKEVTFARQMLDVWLKRLDEIRVLDPACGSGNFLYVALEGLLDLEKQARLWAEDNLGEKIEGRVRPEHFLGLEINVYAHDLAQIVVWIGFLQWQRSNGFEFPSDPILRHTDNIQHCDALLNTENGLSSVSERQWPDADFIIGNPPFLGDKKLRRQLEDDYVESLFKCFRGHVASSSDLCCYWFYKARCQVVANKNTRVGLVATQSICGGKNRETLDAIPNIFFAVSDRDWTLEGANVRISLIGFDGGKETSKHLDGKKVDHIYSNLTSTVDIALAQKLPENSGIAFMGDTKGGSFDIPLSEAQALLQMPNPHLKPNSDVIVPWINGLDIVRRPREMWIIDFGVSMDEEAASLFEQPFSKIESLVKPEREKNKRETYRKYWWRHVEARPALLRAISGLERFLVTVAVSKHQVFSWSKSPILADHSLFVFAREDDYFFGLMHSYIHEIWALRLGTRLEDRPRYTPTSCFETFPFPPFNAQKKEKISSAAKRLNELRENWLNPPEWMREEVLEFQASQHGPWNKHIVPGSLDENGIGTAQFVRQVLKEPRKTVSDYRYDAKTQTMRDFTVTMSDALAHRTLTNLYNHPPTWLKNAHRALDEAVYAAYGFPIDLDDEQILARLLALNLERAELA